MLLSYVLILLTTGLSWFIKNAYLTILIEGSSSNTFINPFLYCKLITHIRRDVLDNSTMFVLLLVSIFAIMIGVHFNHKRKLKKNILNNWGKFPKKSRLDKEKSLRQSYENLQAHLHYDSDIDDITWYDLDLFTIFQDINYTHSSIGSEALYRRLRQFDLDEQSFSQVESFIQFYTEHPKERERIEYIFATLGKKDNNAVVKYLTTSDQKKTSSLAFFILLGSLPFIALLIILFGYTDVGLSLLIGSIVFNVLYSSVKQIAINIELMSMSYLVQSLNTAKKLSKINHPGAEELKELLRPFRSVLRFSFAFRSNEQSEAGILLDYLSMFFMLPFIAYHFVFNQVKRYEIEAIALWQLLGDMEVAYAVMNYRMILPFYSEPLFTDDEDVIAEDVYHPLVEEPVTNPVKWTKNTLVSGSNASGKSTYIKSVAVNCILAQTIQTTLASSFSMKRGHVLTSMAVEDDVVMGDSYFIAEIKSLKRVLKKVKTEERCYLFIDEILRGTNTVEWIAASASIIHWINDYPSLAFVATHDIELTELLKEESDNVHFKETVTEEDGIQFDYLLQDGPATSRNALLLLQTMAFPDSVIESAQELAKQFDEEQVWETV